MTLVSVMVPTFRRPESFRRAVESLFLQQGGPAFEIVAVDNSPEGSALAVAAELAARSPVPMHVAHEPNPGVSNARNAAMRLCNGDRVAFLDDDQTAGPDWLKTHEAVLQQTGADVVFGAYVAVIPEGTPNSEYLRTFFDRTGPDMSGPSSIFWGMGNSYHVRARTLLGSAPFDPARNETGGEDDVLFAALAQMGRRFAWNAEGPVNEYPEPSRLTLRYAFKRAFAYGQGPCEIAASLSPPDVLAIIRHMIIGAGQAVVYGCAGLVALAVRHQSSLFLIDRAVRGVGKVFWMRQLKFYGTAKPA